MQEDRHNAVLWCCKKSLAHMECMLFLHHPRSMCLRDKVLLDHFLDSKRMLDMATCMWLPLVRM